MILRRAFLALALPRSASRAPVVGASDFGRALDQVQRAVFLFKSSATECMRQIWSLVHALRDAGLWVEMQTVENPGRSVYEDEFQIAVVTGPTPRRSDA